MSFPKYDRIALVGTGLSGKELVKDIGPDVAIFTLSVCYNQEMPRRDAVLEMHPQRWLENEKYDPKILEHIKAVDCPVYMMEPYEWAREYPLDEAKILGWPTWRGGAKLNNFFTSSFDYLVALAILHNPLQISIYRFDMATSTEWAYQAPGASYWLGIASGLNIDVCLPEDSPLLYGLLYGYEGTRWITYDHLASLSTQLKGLVDEAEKSANLLAAQVSLNGRKRNKKKLLEKMGAARDEWMVRAGAMSAVEEMLEQHTIDDMITRQELERLHVDAEKKKADALSVVNFWEGVTWERQKQQAAHEAQLDAQMKGVKARDDYFAWKGAEQVLTRLLDETDMKRADDWLPSAVTTKVDINE